VFGIRIGVEPSWFIVLFLIILSLSGEFSGDSTTSFALAVIAALLFFGSVLLHELGHAVVAIRSGIGIQGIDLWLFGGVAKMERDTRSAGEEFRVAIAGPAVTALLAALCVGIVMASTGTSDAGDALLFSGSNEGAAIEVIAWLGFVNALLLVFNLIPGFPLDGGRIARAVAWWRTGDRGKATRFAARLGRAFSFVMIALGVYLLFVGAVISGIWMAFIGYFLGQAARQAEVQTAITDRIEGLRVSDVMDAEPVAIPGELSLDRAADEYFLRYGYPWFPVVDSAGRLTGLVTQGAIDSVPEAARSGRAVASVMAADSGGGLRVELDEPLESLLGLEGLTRLGAIMAVDPEGRLRGIVTVEQVRRALTPA
jgi:Zn-dependent protease